MRLYKTLFLRLVSHHPPRPPHRPISAHFSSSSSSQHTPRRTQHHEEESRGVKVSVWWDFENCHLPTDANVFKVAQSITAAVRINGIKGPITITAFGDVLQLSRTNQEALSSTGINLTHVPQGGKNSTDRALITDLMSWVAINPPPAHLFLISSDRDFSSVLHMLRMSNYNVLLAGYEERSPGVLCSAASIMWDWNALVRGNNLAGRCFNQPPDGPYNSWYGHYKAPLLDPFAISTEQEACTTSVRVEELQDSSLDTVPREVVKEIGLVLSLYPKGVAITELREQLKKRDVPLGEDFYGHKRFSRFLFSMPEILQVVPKGEGVFLVHACARGMDNKAVNVEKMSQKVKQNTEVVKKESESQESSQESESQEMGLEHPLEKEQEDVVSEGKVVDDKDLESQIASATSCESAKEVRAETEVSNEKPESQGILSRLLKRFNFFCGRGKELSNAQADGAVVDDFFAQDSFWKDVESFINSPRGFVVVSHSPSREALAKNLKDGGPSSLKQLDLSKTLDLVSLLISDKKWIKENPSEALPFRVTRFTSCPSSPHASSVLRSMFVNMSRSQREEAESKNNGVSTQKPLEERTRSEVITDCQKLIKKRTEENPGGYNMSNFKKDFLEEFKYRLDYQSLGYPKLQSLIQMMPEARIESGYIVPSSTLAPYGSSSSSSSSVSKKIHGSSEAEKDEGAALRQSEDKRKNEKGDETERDVLQILGCWDSVDDGEKTCGFGKDKLVDGILTSLREKPSGGESRV
ncbi:hypothetical protein Bca4012_059217 [Brassica carinata]|uniref:HTH OST-type domain-containing protein n=1 Tax=Brassica carinata TaxID=52824 RepID=A0A8X7V643_BRACI|nr:hypothetical protein Bca52824_029752 [Brassica carinata]